MRTTLILAFLIAGLAMAQAAWIPDSPGQPPQRHEIKGPEYHGAAKDGPPSADDRIADYTQKLSDFTAVLAAATVLLFVATAGLAYLTLRSVQLGRKEFIASHRPKIRVRAVRVPVMRDHYAKSVAGDTEQKMRWLFLDLANIGESDATIIKIDCDYGRPPDPRDWGITTPPAFATATVTPTAPLVLKVGEQRRFEVVSATLELGTGMDDGTVLHGRIRYLDANGVDRVTGFRRIWYSTQGDFLTSTDQSEEYED